MTYLLKEMKGEKMLYFPPIFQKISTCSNKNADESQVTPSEKKKKKNLIQKGETTLCVQQGFNTVMKN